MCVLSPLGRFIQPDPIGFKGDASNLYRYCGNDWANRTDPTGLEFAKPLNYASEWGTKAWANNKEGQESERGASEEYAMLNVARISFRSFQDKNMGFTMGVKPITITEQLGRSQSSSGQGAGSKASETPGRMEISRSQNRGHFRWVHGQLETSSGAAIREDGYSVQEHFTTLSRSPGFNPKFQTTEDRFVPLGKGQFLDRVGLRDKPDKSMSGDVERLQTFTAKSPNGHTNDLSTKIMHHIHIEHGATTIEVTPITP